MCSSKMYRPAQHGVLSQPGSRYVFLRTARYPHLIQAPSNVHHGVHRLEICSPVFSHFCMGHSSSGSCLCLNCFLDFCHKGAWRMCYRCSHEAHDDFMRLSCKRPDSGIETRYAAERAKVAETSSAATSTAAHSHRHQCLGPPQGLLGQGGAVQNGHARTVPGAPL